MPHTAWASTARNVSPAKFLAALDVLSETGIPGTLALEGTGLTIEDIRRPETRTSNAQFDILLGNLAQLDPRPQIGALLGQRMHVSIYGMFGYALLCSGSLRDVFDTAVEYQPLAGGPNKQSWHVDGETAVWLPMGDFDPAEHGFSSKVASVMRDFHMTSVVCVLRDVMGPWFHPIQAHMTGVEVSHAAYLARTYQCNLQFGGNRNELHFPLSALDQEPQMASPVTAAEVSQACARLLDEMRWDTGITRRVYFELTKQPGEFPDLETISSRLCMTSRTLRRKLEAEGTSFRELIDNVRSALANDYLKSSGLSVDEIASALGFNDPTSFRRAFRRWTGKTPTETRHKSK